MVKNEKKGIIGFDRTKYEIQFRNRRIYMIGMRTFKTGLGIFAALVVSDIFKLQYPFFTVIAVIVVMQNTIDETYQMGMNRILGTALGGVAGILYIQFLKLPNMVLDRMIIGMITIILIVILIRLNAKKAISISLIVFISICINDIKESAVFYALLRILDTIIGIVIALAVNLFVAPPDYGKKFFEELEVLIACEKSIFTGRVKGRKGMKCREISFKLDQVKQFSQKFRYDNKWLFDKKSSTRKREELLQSIWKSASEIYHHLTIIEDLDLSGDISEENMKKFMDLQGETYRQIYEDYFEDEVKTVYDYHVYKILDHFEEAEKDLEQYREIVANKKAS